MAPSTSPSREPRTRCAWSARAAAGTLQLTDWGKDFTLREPGKGDTVDYGAQLPAS